MDALIIDPELSNLFPPLCETAFSSLKEDIKKKGVESSIKVWKETNKIYDGFHRKRAADELGILTDVPVEFNSFPDIDSVKLEMIRIQGSRRNWGNSKNSIESRNMLIKKEYQKRVGKTQGSDKEIIYSELSVLFGLSSEYIRKLIKKGTKRNTGKGMNKNKDTKQGMNKNKDAQKGKGKSSGYVSADKSESPLGISKDKQPPITHNDSEVALLNKPIVAFTETQNEEKATQLAINYLSEKGFNVSTEQTPQTKKCWAVDIDEALQKLQPYALTKEDAIRNLSTQYNDFRLLSKVKHMVEWKLTNYRVIIDAIREPEFKLQDLMNELSNFTCKPTLEDIQTPLNELYNTSDGVTYTRK